MKVGRDELRRF